MIESMPLRPFPGRGKAVENLIHDGFEAFPVRSLGEDVSETVAELEHCLTAVGLARCCR